MTLDSGSLDLVRSRLAEAGEAPTAAAVARALRSEGRLVSDAAVLEAVEALRCESTGAGPLEGLLDEAGVTDVLVNGANEVYVDRGMGLQRVDLTFRDDDAVRLLAQRLAGLAGRRLDDASPYVDVRLPDGCRLHAVLAPLSRPGTCISIRVPARRAMSLEDMVSAGSVSAAGARVLRGLVAARAAFLVSGGTGSGKTTLLAALLSLVDPSARLVIVEDAAELRPDHPHAVFLEARQPNVEGVGEIGLRLLVRQALRMRPDRLVVGEVRGAEVVDMLGAMNTGHEGGCGTVHANSAADVPARLEALAVAAGLPRAALHAQLAAAVQAVVHVRRAASGRRWLAELAVLTRAADGLVVAEPALTFAGGEPVLGSGARRLEQLVAAR